MSSVGPYRLRTFSTVPSAYSACASSLGSASPARFTVRTLAGMPPMRSSSAAAVGTMLTYWIPSSATDGRSSAFSTITSVPPQHSAPNSSATDTSKFTDVEKSTDARSSSAIVSRIQCSSTDTAEWRIITPLGRPVDPEVKITCDRFSGTTPLSNGVSGSAASASRSRSRRRKLAAPSGSRSTRLASVMTSGIAASSSM